jgi:hypothetical protein
MKGRPTGSKKTDSMLRQIAVRLSADLLDRLESEAKAKHIPGSTLIRLILSERYDASASGFSMQSSNGVKPGKVESGIAER